MLDKDNMCIPNENVEVECTICLSSDASEFGLLQCKHSFCFECIESWSEHENSCPLCKVRFSYIDKVTKGALEAATSTGGKKRRRIDKTRIKIKKKDQSNYIPAPHNPMHADAPGDEIEIWANFISSLVGTAPGHGNGHGRGRAMGPLGDSLFDLFAADTMHQRRVASRRPTARAQVRARLRRSSAGMGTFSLTTVPSLPSQPNVRSGTVVGQSAVNPIELSDGEDDRPLPPSSRNNTESRTSALVDLTQEAEVLTAPRLSVQSSRNSSTDNIYNSDDDEDFDPLDMFDDYDDEDDEDDENDDEDDDDKSIVSSEAGQAPSGVRGAMEVIELDDSDNEGESVAAGITNGAAAGAAPAHRLSGIMVWCQVCDSFHDKQHVWDDRDYCPVTYAALLATDGFGDIQRDVPSDLPGTAAGAVSTTTATIATLVPTSSLSASSTIAATATTSAEAPAFTATTTPSNSTLVRPEKDDNRCVQQGSRRSCVLKDKDGEEEAEFDSNIPPAWCESHGNAQRKEGSSAIINNKSASASASAQTTQDEIARTQSDATTSSCRSENTQRFTLDNAKLEVVQDQNVGENGLCEETEDLARGLCADTYSSSKSLH